MSRRKQENPQPRKRLVTRKSQFGLLLSECGCPADLNRTLIQKWRAADPPGMETDQHIKSLSTTVNRVPNHCPTPSFALRAEPEVLQDILTCGVCQKDFALSDIVKFIQHKVHSCNKENYFLYDERDYDSENENDTSIPIVNSRRPSISAPIAKKERPAPPPPPPPAINSSTVDRESNSSRPPSVSSVASTTTTTITMTTATTTTTSTTSPPSSNCDRVVSCTPPTSDESSAGKRGNDAAGHCNMHIPRPKQVDSETNTTNTEPNNYVCSTCKHTFNSAWYLLQHVQNLHGMKIYVEGPVTPTVPTVPPLPEQPPPPHLPLEPPHPFTLLRMPLAERQFAPALNTHNPFARPSSHDFRMELINEQFRLNHPGLGLPPFDHHPFERPHFERPRSLSLGLEPSLDFYSQRLRQLAGTTSPTTSPSPRKLTPPFSSPQPPSSQSSTPQPSQTPTVKPAEASTPKLKACEFCGKAFRFQSNLIVHRRSHTGEKPYKCHICNHACTQASKLKRHMKTHMNKSPGSTVSENTSIESTSSTPDSNTAKQGDGKYNNAEEECSDAPASVETGENDEEEDPEEDEEEEEEEEMEEDEVEEIGSETAEDLTTKSLSASVTPTPQQNSGSNNPEKQSLLGEVMEKIGLSNIQEYNQAYKQALEESNAARGCIKEERPGCHLPETNAVITENGLERTLRMRDDFGKGIIGQPPLDLGHGLLGAFDNPFDANKRIKLELGDHSRERESLYAGLWLPAMPTPRDIFVGVPSSEPDLSRPKPSNESALKSVGLADPNPKPGTSGAPGLAVGVLPPGNGKPKEQRRNDTCEYCGKVFKNCSNLTVHRRSHTGEKPYKCELCSYACAQSSKLTRHMKTHGRVGKDVYRCRFCDMPFSVPSTLEKHMRKCVVNQNSNSKTSETDTDSKEAT